MLAIRSLLGSPAVSLAGSSVAYSGVASTEATTTEATTTEATMEATMEVMGATSRCTRPVAFE